MPVAGVHRSQQGCLFVNSVVDYVEIICLGVLTPVYVQGPVHNPPMEFYALPLETCACLLNAFYASEASSIFVHNPQ